MSNRNKIDKAKILILKEISNQSSVSNQSPVQLNAKLLPSTLQEYFVDACNELIKHKYINGTMSQIGGFANGITKEGLKLLEDSKISNKIKGSFVVNKIILPLMLPIIASIITSIITVRIIT